MRVWPVATINLEDGGAAFLDLHAVLGDVAVGADGRIELLAVGAGDDVLGPVMVELAGRQVRDLDARRRDLGRALRVREAYDCIGVGDVEIAADQRHAERRIQVLQECRLGFCDPISVGVAQQHDLVRALAPCTGTRHDEARHPTREAAPVAAAGRRIGFATRMSPLGSL